MSNNATADKILSDSEVGLRFWKTHTDIKINEATPTAYEKSRTAFETILAEVRDLESLLAAKMSQRDRLGEDLNDISVRLKSAVKGMYGPDSGEYEQVGGTRASDRKRPVRKTAVAGEEAAK